MSIYKPIVSIPRPKYGTIEPAKVSYRNPTPSDGDTSCFSCMNFLPNSIDGAARCKVVVGEISGARVCDEYDKDGSKDWTGRKTVWMLSEEEKSRGRIKSMHNLYKGQEVFVIGTGPSLDKVTDKSLKALSRKTTFGVNTLLSYPRLPFTPSLYCVAESGWLEGISIPNVIEQLKKLPERRYYVHHWPLENLEGWTFVPYNSGAHIEQGDFQGLGEGEGDLPYVSNGRSVVCVVLQLVCYFGFKTVYLLGVDATRNGHAKGVHQGKWDALRGRQDAFIRAISSAHEIMSKNGRDLVNLTVGGDLDIPRRKLEDVL